MKTSDVISETYKIKDIILENKGHFQLRQAFGAEVDLLAKLS